MVDDHALDALRAASDHFAEVTRILDEAIARATRVGDDELVERLSRAKSAADRGETLIGKIGAILADDAGQDHASIA